MAERLSRLSDPELGAVLVDLAGHIEFPPEVNVAPAVYRRLREAAIPVRRPSLIERLIPGRAARRAVILALALVVLAGGAAVAGLLGVPGLKLIFRPEASPGVSSSLPPVGARLFLGTRVSADRAAKDVSFPVLRPHVEGLPEPEYYVLATPVGGEVTLAYRAGPGFPPARFTHVGLLLSEFLGTLNPEVLQKVITPGTNVEPVQVNGGPGFWIVGRPHEVFLTDRHGRPFAETVHLAGNTLVWRRGDTTLRIEGAFGKARALQIARSVN